VDFLPVFIQALIRRGLSERLYVDNGANYRPNHFALVCRQTGCCVIFRGIKLLFELLMQENHRYFSLLWLIDSPNPRIKPMRLFSLILLAAIFINPAYSDSDESGSSYKSGDWRIAKAGKLIKKERYKTAVKQLRKALKKDDKNAEAWNLLGFASRKMGEFDVSADAYSKALSIQPDHKGALEYQGELFIAIGQINNAKSNLARLTELCPGGCDERIKLKQALSKLP